jgi:hypothetical protein
MRKMTRGLGAASALALLVAWPVVAGVAEVKIADNGISVQCFTEEDGTSVTIAGTVTVKSGSSDFALTLMGNKGDGDGYDPIGMAGNPKTISNSGADDYDFEFDITGVDPDYKSFRVDSTSAWANPEKSRSFHRDECGTPIDEAPFAVLFLITGGLMAVWFATRQLKAPAPASAA